MKELNIFKISYQGYEDDCGETLLGKNITREGFEKDLIDAKKFAESLIGVKIKGYKYVGKGYTVECLPQYYAQIIWFLTEKKGYAECNISKDIEYFIDDGAGKKVDIRKRVQKTEWKELKVSREKADESKTNTQSKPKKVVIRKKVSA